MNTHSRKSLHFINDQDRKDRVDYCKRMLAELEAGKEGLLIFSDEVSHEESTHPKVSKGQTDVGDCRQAGSQGPSLDSGMLYGIPCINLPACLA